MCNTLLKPMRANGVELWGSGKPSSISKIQSLQSKILRKLTNAPFYASNQTTLSDLKVPFVLFAIDRYKKISWETIIPHKSLSPKFTFSPHRTRRRLNRNWPRDLLQAVKWQTTRYEEPMGPPTIFLFVCVYQKCRSLPVVVII